MMSTKWCLGMGLWCLGSAGAAQDDGRALLERTCTKCHALNATTRQRNDRERWSAIVDDMVVRGAELSDAEIEKIAELLIEQL